jgi:uncharacterized membrane protein YkvA (DUF1232 family)
MTDLEDPARLLHRYRRRAEKEAREPSRVRSIVRRAGEKLREHGPQLGSIAEDLPVLLRLGRAWSRGEYREVPWRSAVVLVAGLLYFLAPTDTIPDFVPVLGFVDDAAAVAYVLRAIRADVRAFEEWEAEVGEEEALAPLSA